VLIEIAIEIEIGAVGAHFAIAALFDPDPDSDFDFELD
jgi:hypothetical protein